MFFKKTLVSIVHFCKVHKTHFKTEDMTALNNHAHLFSAAYFYSQKKKIADPNTFQRFN